jgi:hypothetical protein
VEVFKEALPIFFKLYFSAILVDEDLFSVLFKTTVLA